MTNKPEYSGNIMPPTDDGLIEFQKLLEAG